MFPDAIAILDLAAVKAGSRPLGSDRSIELNVQPIADHEQVHQAVDQRPFDAVELAAKTRVIDTRVVDLQILDKSGDVGRLYQAPDTRRTLERRVRETSLATVRWYALVPPELELTVLDPGRQGV